MTTASVVVDASVLLDALLDPAERGDAARSAITGHTMAGPEHLQVETFHVVRRLVMAGLVTEPAGHRAVTRLGLLAVQTVPTPALLQRIWQLRDNLTGYDAAYVAAAEHLQVDLLTRDEGIHTAADLNCRVRRP